MPDTVTDGWVDVGGINTRFVQVGSEGPVLVLLHGGGPGMSGEVAFAPLFAPLAAHGYRVFAPDQVSMGLTDTGEHAWPTGGYDSLVAHVAGFIDELGADKIVLCGHSQGAYVAARYTAENPDRVHATLLLGSNTTCRSMGIEGGAGNVEEAMAAYDDTLAGMRRLLSLSLGEAGRADLDLMAEKMFAAAIRPGAAQSRAAFEAARVRTFEDPAAWSRYNLIDRLPACPVPLRVIWGLDDTLALISGAEELSRRLPGVPFDFLERCGHNVAYDRAEDVLAALYAMRPSSA